MSKPKHTCPDCDHYIGSHYVDNDKIRCSVVTSKKDEKGQITIGYTIVCPCVRIRETEKDI